VGLRSNRIAIVGFGPRGLGALECLVRHAGQCDATLAVDLFDPVDWPAAGPNFSPDESKVCLLNLPVRSIDLPAPPNGAGVGDMPEWLGQSGADAEAFVPRARLGAYMNARFRDLLTRLPDGMTVTLHQLRITGAERDGRQWRLAGGQGRHGPYDHVLLSLGQPESGDDDQTARWRTHATRSGLSFMEAYPATALVEAAGSWAGRTVGIRGLGLSALDVVQALTLGLGGRFEAGRYLPSGREPARIVPFSLDGHAPAPKPLNETVDALFEPLPEENESLQAALGTALRGPSGEALKTVCDAIALPALRILRAAGADADAGAVDRWLAAEREAPGSQEKRGTIDALRAGLAEAVGDEPPSVGYVVGQLWRKWQPLLREVYDRTQKPADMAQAMTGFDEGLKRYSYGAPVETLQNFLTLAEAGLVDPRAADDPDIALTADGWQLEADDRAVTASVMVDSVLPPAALAPVSDPLVAGLMQASCLAAVADGLGARCNPDGAAIGADGAVVEGLWLTGRLTNGSTIAADSIHDCFGIIQERWAKAVVARIGRTDSAT
jgi:uncharacterized NAD(P)/FAD-binding protein YdhS